MLGNLTIDKASMNISYFLMTIRIIANAGGRISRKDFVQQMASFIGLPAIKDGKENRTPYNKSKLPRYFGFVGIETTLVPLSCHIPRLRIPIKTALTAILSLSVLPVQSGLTPKRKVAEELLQFSLTQSSSSITGLKRMRITLTV